MLNAQHDKSHLIKAKYYGVLLIIGMALSWNVMAEQKERETFNTVGLRGTQVACLPELDKLIVSGQHYSLTTEKMLEHLQKDSKKTYSNDKDGKLFSAIGDFNYRCQLNNKTLMVRVDFLNKMRKESKSSTLSPHDYPVPWRSQITMYTHRLRISSGDKTIVDIDRFNGTSKYTIGATKIMYDTWNITMEYMPVFIGIGQSYFWYGGPHQGTINPFITRRISFSRQKFKEIITYEDILRKELTRKKNMLNDYKMLPYAVEQFCTGSSNILRDKCPEYFTTRDFVVNQIEKMLNNYLQETNK